jgi:RNA polymerase sigma factor (TIGR02999 family)
LEPKDVTEPPHDITQLLRRVSDGDHDAENELLTLLYAQLHEIARAHFRGLKSPADTLQPTALVHEAYVKMFHNGLPAMTDRGHFMALAASAMRSVLVDRARARGTAKRGENPSRVPFEALLLQYEERGFDVIGLDDALIRLAAESPEAARIVEMRFFGGLTQPQIAEFLGISVSDVERDWRMARAWLRRELDRGTTKGSASSAGPGD